ncbi:hypothetical protein Tco_1064833 [Tanacetum coccineum]
MSKILVDILNNHPLGLCVAAFTSVPWIYIYQFWHTLKMNESKYKFKFVLDTKEVTMTVVYFRRIFRLPQATDNNHAGFVEAPTFSQMVSFFRNVLGCSLTLQSPSNFASKGLSQPWQTLCKIFARCLTTRVTGYDQSPVQIMQMLYCFINNVHVDYAELLWEGLYYSFTHPTTLIPYPRFTKIIINHYMTEHPDISRRVHDNYHIVKNDDLVKNIFNSGKNKEGTGMKFMHDDDEEMKLLPLSYGTHRTTSAPRTPNPKVTEGESSAQCKSIVIRLHVPPRRQDPETPIPTATEIDVTNLAETIQMSISTQRSIVDYEARQNVEKVKAHMVDEEIKNLSDRESPEVEKDDDMMTFSNDDVEEEPAGDEFELRRREKGKGIEETKDTPPPTPTRSPRTHISPLSIIRRHSRN